MGKGLTTYQEGDTAGAELDMTRAIEILRVAVGEEHPDYLQAVYNLAHVYLDTGQLQLAEPLFRQLIAVVPSALGGHHPLIEACRDGWEQTRRQLGVSSDRVQSPSLSTFQRETSQSQSLPYAEGATNISSALLGDLRACLQSFAERDYETCLNQAMKLVYRQASISFWLLVLICLKRLERDMEMTIGGIQCLDATKSHPWEHELVRLTLGHVSVEEVLTKAQTNEQRCQASYYAAARCLWEKNEEAAKTHLEACCSVEAQCYERMFAEYDLSELLGERDALTVNRLSDSPFPQLFAQFKQVYDLGHYREALALAQRTAELARHQLPQVSEERALALNNLAETLRALGQYESAEPLYLEACESLQQALGEDHPNVAVGVNNLAELYRAQGRYREADKLYRQSGRILRQALGDRHPNIATNLVNLGELYRAMGDEETAQSYYSQALDIYRTTMGSDHLFVARTLHNIARSYIAQGKREEALTHFQQALDLFRLNVGEEHPEYALCFANSTVLYLDSPDQTQVERKIRQAVDLMQRCYGPQHPYYLVSLNNLGSFYSKRGMQAKAEKILSQVLELQRQAVGERHPDVARTLLNLAFVVDTRHDHVSAQRFLQQATEILREVVGQTHPDFLLALIQLAKQCQMHRNSELADICLRQIGIVLESLTPELHSHFIDGSRQLGHLYQDRGDLSSAQRCFQRALDFLEPHQKEAPEQYTASLIDLASLYNAQGHYLEAKELGEKSLSLTREVFGENSQEYAVVLNNLAAIYISLRDLDEAEETQRQAISIMEQAQDRYCAEYAQFTNNLATICAEKGELDQAETLYLRALEVRERVLGEDHPDSAKTHKLLGTLYNSMGLYRQAAKHLQSALFIQKSALGEVHPDYVNTLNSLALFYRMQEDFDQAEDLLNEAIALFKETLGEHHLDMAILLANLGDLKFAQGDYASAKSLHHHALEIWKQAIGDQHPLYATGLNNVALAYYRLGEADQAVKYQQQALEIRRAALGENHPEFITSMWNLAVLYTATRQAADILPLFQEALAYDERLIGQGFRMGSDSARMAFLNTIRAHLDVFLSVVTEHLSISRESVEAALNLVLRRKALTLEALVTQRETVLSGKYPQLVPKLRELRHLRSLVARRSMAGLRGEDWDEFRDLIRGWRTRIEKLEEELARECPEMNLDKQLQAVDCESVARALPSGSVLVEFVRWHEVDLEKLQGVKPRYSAFVLPGGEPENLQMIELGDAAAIDQMIADFRASITGEYQAPVLDGLEVMKIGATLRATVFDPLHPAIGSCKRLLLAPDGDLARLSFEALPTGDGNWLIDEYQFSYVTVGREVLRFQGNNGRESTEPVILADPDFDLCDSDDFPQIAPGTRRSSLVDGSTVLGSRLSRDLDRSHLHFTRLPGTRTEGRRIAEMLNVKPWLDRAALEGRLKSCRSPHILHLATHGFFLRDQNQHGNREFRDLSVIHSTMGDSVEQFALPALENPLLRSGLALTGANTWLNKGRLPDEAEDGLLTAEDVSGMDLLNTELVVLSACETGLGSIHVGEGVMGLQRSFALAGAKTLVMSLWKVPDRQTQQLMEDFYGYILAGKGRAEALRQAQLSMKERHPAPLYWGAFICQGEPDPLPTEHKSSSRQ